MEQTLEPVVETVTQTPVSFFSKLLENKLYLIILGVVIVLGAIGYYLYFKYMKGGSIKSLFGGSSPVIETKKHILNPSEEYYLLDPNGNPILISPYFNDIVRSHILQNQPRQRPQLIHPADQKQQPVQRIQQTETQQESDNEDDNIGQQELTSAEIEELKRQLEALERSQNNNIMAQNDSDDE